MSRRRSFRGGFSIKDAVVVLIIIGVVLGIGFPAFVYIRERTRLMQCEANLKKIGQALDRYKSSDPGGGYPIGSAYDAAHKSSGVSWWVEILPHAESSQAAPKWTTAPARGDFNSSTPNPNVAWADGHQPNIFFCPSSPLAMFNDPERHMSADNRKLVTDHSPIGIAVPMYAAIAGSVPDFRDTDIRQPNDKPAGRNTQDGKWGVLSGSGVFPPNMKVQHAAIFDQKGKTIMVVEQSGYVRDEALDPPDLYDIRSSWPKGAYMGTAGNYADLKQTQTGINGDGGERCWNITSLRYPINVRDIKGKKGIVTDPPNPRPAKEGDDPPPPPPYPAEGYGPGHNHPIVAAHPGGANVLMADGSTQFLNETIDLGLLLWMSTRDDRNNVAD